MKGDKKDDSKIIARQNKNKELIIEELKKTPIVEIACQKSGVSRATFYRWCKNDADFAEQATESLLGGKLLINDMAESQLISAIKDQNMTAIIFWLKSNHQAYRNRVELTASKPREELTKEQETIVRQALQLTKIVNLEEEN